MTVDEIREGIAAFTDEDRRAVAALMVVAQTAWRARQRAEAIR